MNKLSLKSCIVAISLALPLALPAQAMMLDQSTDTAQKEMRHHKGKSMAKHQLKRMARFLQLDDAQIAQIKTIYQDAKIVKEQNKASRKAFRDEMKALVQSENFTEQAFLTLHQQNQDQLTESALQRAKTKNAIYLVLNDEQREKFAKFQEKRKNKQKGKRKGKRKHHDS
ncbi:Spy/CpxP family protein refolding chaperone [Thalassotalea hakodatensis]|uniref:Spy/CpxP family protein refolding chaperone n=1 Tax=Thalassotalea hakodatensis TaxID=3030492 RepID=UPI002573B7A3|nr:Spy/CpxP family protein refolding chaperone [Thalassotalea hakodatensis]